MIWVRMRRDEIIELLDFVTLERVEHHFALAGITGIDKH